MAIGGTIDFSGKKIVLTGFGEPAGVASNSPPEQAPGGC